MLNNRASMSTTRFYAPKGNVETSQNKFWTVNAKLPFPVEGPIYDLAGFLFKPTLKRLNPNGHIDLEVELISSIDPQMPLQVGFTVETSNPPNEKTLVHSNQKRFAALSDRDRIIEVKMVVMADRWDVAKGLHIHFMFEPIHSPRLPYACFWNSDSTKDVEIRFADPQVSPILAHKNFVLEYCPLFKTLIKAVDPTKNVSGSDGTSLTPGQFLTHDCLFSPCPESPTPASTSALSTPRLTPLSAAQIRRPPTVQEADFLLSSDDSSYISKLHSTTDSSVHAHGDRPFSSSKDNLSLTESDRDSATGRNSEDVSLIDESDIDERRPLFSQGQARVGNGVDGSDSGLRQQQQGRNKNRKALRLAKREQGSTTSSTRSTVDARQPSSNAEQHQCYVEWFNQELEAKRQASQQERELAPNSPLTHNFPGVKIASPSLDSQREIWYWTNNLHPSVCSALLHWLYLEQVPTCPSGDGPGGGVYRFDMSEVLLSTFAAVDQPILFQRFLTSQLNLISQRSDLTTFWKAPELAQQGTMINRFFRPVLVQNSSSNILELLRTAAYRNALASLDPSNILGDVIARQATYRQ
ncbi:hypothetical protein EC991_008547 [Linnemannia zychae]|nr:hypothetical protein EC991_008547 [Linnemannia zychae]